MMLITIICFLTTDSTVCNGDEQDTDSKSVDMESLSELKVEPDESKEIVEENIGEAEQDDDWFRVKIADLGNACWVHHLIIMNY